jgi:hypothetical protein
MNIAAAHTFVGKRCAITWIDDSGHGYKNPGANPGAVQSTKLVPMYVKARFFFPNRRRKTVPLAGLRDRFPLSVPASNPVRPVAAPSEGMRHLTPLSDRRQPPRTSRQTFTFPDHSP